MVIGGIDSKGIDAAAQLAVLGIDPLRFLTTKDAFERNLMLEVARRAGEYIHTLQLSQAKLIISELSKAMKTR